MDTESMLVPLIPAPFDASLTPYPYLDVDDRVEEYIENEIFRPNRKIPLRTAKCVLVGAPSSGKTSLIRRLGANGLILGHHRSAGKIDYWIQEFEILGVPFRLQIWDTVGSENICKSFYQDAQVIVLLFDLVKPESLKEFQHFVLEVREHQEEEHQVLMFVVGSKSDSVSELYCKNVEKELYDIVSQIGAEYWTVSSLTGKNIKNLFSRIAALSFVKIIKTEIEVMEAFKKENSRQLYQEFQIEVPKVKKRKRRCKCLIA